MEIKDSHRAIASLRPREVSVLRKRFGLDTDDQHKRDLLAFIPPTADGGNQGGAPAALLANARVVRRNDS